MPLYPFARERHWRGDAGVVAPAPDNARTVVHALTGHEWFFEDHVVDGERLLPAVMYLDLARRSTRASALRDVTWQRPLAAGDGPVRVEVGINGSRFTIRSETAVLCEGSFASEPAAQERRDIEAIRRRCTRRTQSEDFYAALRGAGFAYGPRLRGLLGALSNDREVLAELAPAEGETAPAMLEAALQSLAAIGAAIGADLPLPFALGAIEWRIHLIEHHQWGRLYL